MDKNNDIAQKASKLLNYVGTENTEKLIELLKAIKSNESKETFSEIVNFRHGRYGVTALQVAAFKNNLNITEIILQISSRPNISDLLGRTALHHAANNGSSKIVQLLLSKEVSVNAQLRRMTTWKEPMELQPDPLIPIPREWGRTALHLATAGLHDDCVKLLLDNGADVRIKDDKGITPLLSTAEKRQPVSIECVKLYETVIELLLRHEADVNVKDTDSGKTPFHKAIEFKSLKVCRALLERGFDAFQTDTSGDTILHLACKISDDDVAKLVLKKTSDMDVVNSKNRRGETPLHCAAYAGSRKCLTLLLNNGGDLSQENASGLSVCDLMFSYMPRPMSFLTETLNSKIIPNEYSINDRQFKVALDFGILLPNNNSQMAVVIALVNSMTSDQKCKLILHPLIETFLRLKWIRLRVFYFFLAVIYLFFAVSLSTFITFLISNSDHYYMVVSRLVLLFTATVITVHLLFQVAIAPKYSFKEYETWLTLTCVSMTFAIQGWEFFEVKIGLTVPEWVRHLAAYAVLLAWTQLMLILGRFPLIGYFALMFFTVLENVIKVLLFFACLVIGFSLSFCVQFDDKQFTDPWKAFVRTTIMLMGEYEYTSLFDEDKLNVRFTGVAGSLFVTSRFIFLLFVFLGSIVLMNLMTGLAVNDLQALKADGNASHMLKQAEFISHAEKLLLREKLQSRCIPRRIRNFFNERNTLLRTLTLHPNEKEKICEMKYKSTFKFNNNIPFQLMETIVLVAIKNQKDILKNQSEAILLQDGAADMHEWRDNQIAQALADMRKELQALSSVLKK